MIFDGLFNQQQSSSQGESPYARMLEDPKFALGYGLLTSRENPLGAAMQIMGQGEKSKQAREDGKLKNILLQAKLQKAMSGGSAFAGTSMDAQSANLAYQDALNQGLDDFSARKYAADKIQTSKQSFAFDAAGRPIARNRTPIFGSGDAQAPVTTEGKMNWKPSDYEQPVDDMNGELPALNIGGGNIEANDLPPQKEPQIQQPPLNNQPNDINTVDTQGMVNNAFSSIPPELWASNPRGAQVMVETQLKNIPEKEKKIIGRQKFTEAIKQLEDVIDAGAKNGFLTSENQSTTQNITNRAFTTDAGKAVAGYLGNDRATWLQDFDGVRSSVVPIMMQSYGLGATQLNTASEMEKIMAQIASGSMTKEAAKKNIQRLKEREGLTTVAPQQDMGSIEAEMRRRGLLK